MVVRSFSIPGLGYFGITRVEEETELGGIEFNPGYYETNGAGFITECYENAEEAEVALIENILIYIERKSRKFEDKMDLLNREII